MCPKIAKERKKIVSTTQVLCEYRKHSRNHYRMRSINFQLKMVSGEKYPSCFYGKDIENRKWIQLTKKCNKNSNSDISFLQNVWCAVWLATKMNGIHWQILLPLLATTKIMWMELQFIRIVQKAK